MRGISHTCSTCRVSSHRCREAPQNTLGEMRPIARLEPPQFGSVRCVLIPNKPGIGSSACSLHFDTDRIERNSLAKHPNARRRAIGKDCSSALGALQKREPKQERKLAPGKTHAISDEALCAVVGRIGNYIAGLPCGGEEIDSCFSVTSVVQIRAMNSMPGFF